MTISEEEIKVVKDIQERLEKLESSSGNNEEIEVLKIKVAELEEKMKEKPKASGLFSFFHVD